MNTDAGLETFRDNFHGWLDRNVRRLDQFRLPPRSAEEQVTQGRAMQRLLFEEGWAQHGWPERVGGLGGTSLRRGIIAEELTRHGTPPPFACILIEVLGPAVIEFGDPEMVRTYFPRLLDGTDLWCQGFSEPEAGSDLGSLRTRAIDDGDHWRVNGQKIWTSHATSAQRCLLLVRTGLAEDGFKGITALFVDMDSPGIDVRPLKAMSGDEEFAEVFFDDVLVPKDRILGTIGGGAAVTMNVLANERGVLAWQRQAWLHRRLLDIVHGMAHSGELAASSVGRCYAGLYALRLQVRGTFHSIAAGGNPGPETSVDKVLLSTAEQAVFDAAYELDPEFTLLADGAEPERWRYDHTYSRASSIYGGTKEIQRNIIAERLLGLPRER